MHLTSQHIPELAGLKLQQRMLVIKHATAMLSVPQKLVLNLLKIFILVHFFSVLARFEGWMLVPWLLAAGLAYPLIINPVTFWMTRSKMADARKALDL